ncbi:hypothetical protein Hanom_Chr02g00133481 [Helianthus anomalus]
MWYRGSYAPTIKKLLHPYWRFLAQIYLMCISGNKSGIDKLTIRQTSGWCHWSRGGSLTIQNVCLTICWRI